MQNLTNFRTGLACAAMAVLVLPAYGERRNSAPAVVTQYCSGCHGVDGRSQLPFIPRLAGLRADYTRQKLSLFKTTAGSPVDETFTSFRRKKRGDVTDEASVHMVGVSHALSETQVAAATEWYASQQSPPRSGGNRATDEQGRNLFMNGATSKGLVACQTCHGSDGQGTEKAPRLAGQNAAYIVRQLGFLGRRRAYSDSPMPDIARRMDADQARAVAAYLQSHR
jgi:cytochrome c553